MGDEDFSKRGGWSFRTHETPAEPLDYRLQVPVATGGPPLDLHMVFTEDGLYVPALVRRPPGEGPFPTAVCLHGGSGGLGIPWLVDFVQNEGYLFERLLDAGYAVCVTEGRMETEDAYGHEPVEATTPSLPTVLDHQDVATVLGYLRDQSFVDADRVGFVGVSHGGELSMKVLSAGGETPDAVVALEPGVIEYLGLEYPGERTFENLQFNDPVDDDQLDLERATERIDAVPADVPILVGGRDEDHLQGLFEKLYDLLERADRPVTWESWSYPDHAYQWGPRRSSSGSEAAEAADGAAAYEPDEVQRATADRVVAFLDERLAQS